MKPSLSWASLKILRLGVARTGRARHARPASRARCAVFEIAEVPAMLSGGCVRASGVTSSSSQRRRARCAVLQKNTHLRAQIEALSATRSAATSCAHCTSATHYKYRVDVRNWAEAGPKAQPQRTPLILSSILGKLSLQPGKSDCCRHHGSLPSTNCLL